MTATPGVLTAILEVQREVTHVDKADQFNGGGVRYAYRGVDRVVQALSGAMRKHGLLMLPKCHTAPEWVPVTTAQGKPANVVRLLVTYDLYGPDGSNLEVTAPGEAMDSGDKAVSKAMSVAWRTALIQTFNLPTGEPDPDSENYEVAATGQPTTRAAAAIQRTEQYDQVLTQWNDAIEGSRGDYEALGKLYMEAQSKKVPAEILERIKAEGNKAKS